MNARLVRIADWRQRATESDWRVQTLARQCGVSVSTLARHIKEQFGMSSRDWLAELQMAQAKEMLTKGFSVKQAALELGYIHPHHFSRDFKKQMGYSPSQHASHDQWTQISQL